MSAPTRPPTGLPTAPPVAAPVPAPDLEHALPAGKPPVGTGLSPLVAQLIALALVALGVVGVQNLLVSLDVVQGSSWLNSAVDVVDGLDATSPGVRVAAVVAIVLGVLLLPVVVRRRPRTGLELSARTGVHLRPADLERVLEARLHGTDAVTSTHVRVRRRRIRVVVRTLAGPDRTPEITERVNGRLESSLAALARRPRVKVTVKAESD